MNIFTLQSLKHLFLLALIGLMACSPSSQRSNGTGDDTEDGREELDSSVFATFLSALDQESPATAYPTDGAQFIFDVTYSSEQTNAFSLEVDNRTYNCRYTYSQARLTTTYTKETVASGEKEVVSYSVQNLITPSEPIYAGIPATTAAEEACDGEIDQLDTLSSKTSVNFETAWENYKTAMNAQFVAAMTKCQNRGTVNGVVCEGVSLTKDLSSSTPFTTFSLDFTFTWDTETSETRWTRISVYKFLQTSTIFQRLASSILVETSQMNRLTPQIFQYSNWWIIPAFRAQAQITGRNSVVMRTTNS